MKLVLLGPPGVGKGTQAVMLAEKYSLLHISTGEMLRSEITKCTTLGIEAKSHINKGHLVPDELMIGMLKERLKEKDAENGYILDGFPRTVTQARELDEVIKLDAVIYMDADPSELILRLSNRRVCAKCRTTTTVGANKGNLCPRCGEKLTQRDDDKPEVVATRLMVYKEQTLPIIDYYQDAGIVKTVHAVGSIESVFNKIVDALDMYKMNHKKV